MLLDSKSFPRDKVKSQTKLRTFKQLQTANVVILWTWNHCQVRLKWQRWWKSVYCMYIIWWYKLVFVSQHPQVKASFLYLCRICTLFVENVRKQVRQCEADVNALLRENRDFRDMTLWYLLSIYVTFLPGCYWQCFQPL